MRRKWASATRRAPTAGSHGSSLPLPFAAAGAGAVGGGALACASPAALSGPPRRRIVAAAVGEDGRRAGARAEGAPPPEPPSAPAAAAVDADEAPVPPCLRFARRSEAWRRSKEGRAEQRGHNCGRDALKES